MVKMEKLPKELSCRLVGERPRSCKFCWVAFFISDMIDHQNSHFLRRPSASRDVNDVNMLIQMERDIGRWGKHRKQLVFNEVAIIFHNMTFCPPATLLCFGFVLRLSMLKEPDTWSLHSCQPWELGGIGWKVWREAPSFFGVQLKISRQELHNASICRCCWFHVFSNLSHVIRWVRNWWNAHPAKIHRIFREF